MSRGIARLWLLVCLLLALPAMAQTRAWLDRAEIRYGETATLNIETTLRVTEVDYAPLRAQFDIAGQTVRRSFDMSNGRTTARALFAVGIRPRGPGVLLVPALQVGGQMTTPLRLTVLPPSVQPPGSSSDVFVETEVDATQPYVQQAVGVLVRLHYAVPLLSGQLDQEPADGASIRQVGEDLTYRRQLGGRDYSVVERRYLLIPERSGELVLPGARFNGITAGGFDGAMFDPGREPVSTASPLRRLQVRPIPANAPQPWLPLRQLGLRYLQVPKQARVGEAATLEIEMLADGASAVQLPQLALAQADGVQVFADPPQADEAFTDGRPRTTVRRRIALVPLAPGELTIPGPQIDWWDAVQGVPRTASLPPIRLQVAPATSASQGAPAQAEAGQADASHQGDAASPAADAHRDLQWLLQWKLLGGALLVVIALALTAWWLRGRASAAAKPAGSDAMPQAAASTPPALASALRAGELGAIAAALIAEAGPGAADLDAVRLRLSDAGQADAVAQLQAARWGGSDPVTALVALRSAFAKGAAWRASVKPDSPILPPLYPER